MTKQSATLSTVERAFEMVHTLHDMEGARVSELASEMDMAPSTAYKYLTTLQQLGYLVKDGDEYQIGLKFLWPGTYARHCKEGYQFSIEKVKQIAEETGERAQFVVEENGRGIYLHTEASKSTAVQTDRRAGISRHLHSSASGKAILAHLPETRIEEIIETNGLPAETEDTITNRGELYDELEKIRESEVAFNDEESVTGLRAVGVPVKETVDGFVLGSLSVSGPSNRLAGSVYREELPNLLLGYANEIELNIRYS